MQKLRFERLGNRRRDFHLAQTRLGAGQATLEHGQDFPEVFLVTAGAGWHHWNGRVLSLGRGALAWVDAADRHHYESDGREPLVFINLALAPKWWRKAAALGPKGLRRRLRGTGSGRILSEGETARCERVLHRLMADGREPELALMAAVAVLWRALLVPSLSTSEVSSPAWLAAWVAGLQEPGGAVEPLAALQRRSGRSAEHLARSCRRYYGVVPTELINRARVEQVQAALRRAEGKIATLALEAGFQNLGYFYRVFRRLTGKTPRAWMAGQNRDAAVPRAR
jgi:AraC family transcriptional regulator, dual regulator of chb operon